VVKAQGDNREIAIAAARVLEAQAQSHNAQRCPRKSEPRSTI
jgi:hypothetical protein